MRGNVTAQVGQVRAIVMFVGEPVPDWLAQSFLYHPWFDFIHMDDVPGNLSIGHYHNKGAALAQSEWIMKLDIDTLPNARYFEELLPILKTAGQREWFNGGMIYLSEKGSKLCHTDSDYIPYQEIMSSPRSFTVTGRHTPQSTNFICRRQDYLNLGGCDERFRGWGWEDYQQIYMLERHQLGHDPLPDPITMINVTSRCRDCISKPKAAQLLARSKWLCLLHHWHPKSGGDYKNPRGTDANRKVLFDYIMQRRST